MESDTVFTRAMMLFAERQTLVCGDLIDMPIPGRTGSAPPVSRRSRNRAQLALSSYFLPLFVAPLPVLEKSGAFGMSVRALITPT
jgi:hypothetical protein